jgi:hypothetical protein
MKTNPGKVLGWSAMAGFAVWCALSVAVHARWTLLGLEWGLQLNITGVFLLAPLVTTPLALLLGEPQGAGGRKAWMCASLLQPVAAAAVLGSFLLAPGGVAAGLAVPWAIFSLCAAASGLGRFMEHGFSRPEEVAIDVGLSMLPVGAVWLLASRAGQSLAGFSEPFVLLTAVHFHFAGLVAAVIVGLAGRRLRAWNSKALPFYFVLAAGVVFGVPLLAAGIASHTKFEVVAALILAFSLGGFCIFALFAIVPRLPGWPARILVALAFLSAIWSMHYAGHYAASLGRGGPPPAAYSIPKMATVHGLLNALGFSLCGLLGWVAAGRAEGKSHESRKTP